MLAAEIAGRPGATAIVYDGGAWGFAYFPMIYRFGASFPQYFRDSTGGLHRLGADGDPNTPALPSSELDRYGRILVATVALKTYRDLRPLAHDEHAVLTFTGVSSPFASGAGWVATAPRIYPGLFSLRLLSFDRDHAR